MTNFTAQNDLEKYLLSLMNGSMEGEEFLGLLMDAQVYMPVLGDINTIKQTLSPDSAQPLVIEDEDGNRVLILFTSLERARDYVKDFPGYGEGGLLTEFSWILRRMGRAMPVHLNPGLDVGFDMDAETVSSMQAELPREN